MIATRTVNEFWGPRLNVLADKIGRITDEAEVSLLIWDYSYSENGLTRLIEVGEKEVLELLSQSFPAMAGKAKRLFERAMIEDRNRVTIVELPDDRLFATVATPENLMIFATKSKDGTIGRLVLEKTVAVVADIRPDFPASLEQQPRPKIAEFKPAFYGRHLAALS